MPPRDHELERGMDPLAPLEQLGHWLVTTTVHLAIAVALGFLLAGELRRRGLRWTWSAPAFLLAMLARPLLAAYAPMLAVLGLTALVRGRRWHREDLRAGADLAEIAEARRGPLAAVETGLRPLRRRTWPAGRNALQTGTAASESSRLIVGHGEGAVPVSIRIGENSRGRHTLIVGATGSGKTVTATWIAAQAIARGMGVVAVDPKGDVRLASELARCAREHGRRLIRWTPQGDAIYNPYARGSATEIADKALAGERFTEPHYMRQAQRYLGVEARALQAAGVRPSLGSIVEHLDPARLEALARELPSELASSTYGYLDSLTTRQRSDLSGIRDRLSVLAESDFARWLEPGTGDVPFDLLDAARERAVVYFDLQADTRPLLAQMLGVAIVIDLQSTVAALQSTPTATLAILDEFSAIGAEQVTRLFGRARSAGVSLLLGTQELSDLRLPGREGVLEQVLGNLSTLIAHRQLVPTSAELVSRLGGTRGVWRTSSSSDGRWSRSRVSAPVLRAELVQGLPDGHAAVIDLSGHPVVAIARMLAVTRASSTSLSWVGSLAGQARRVLARKRVRASAAAPSGRSGLPVDHNEKELA
jgi:Type IV secretion-system coupling protein DNA-binding domain